MRMSDPSLKQTILCPPNFFSLLMFVCEYRTNKFLNRNNQASKKKKKGVPGFILYLINFNF